MLNSQLCTPENEAKKKAILDGIMLFNPGLGSMDLNYEIFKINIKEAVDSGLFTPTEIQKLNMFWNDYWATMPRNVKP